MATEQFTQPIQEVIDQIVSKNDSIAKFWSSAHGWAPLDAAGLLCKSRLDRQVSLSRTLALWVKPVASEDSLDADGRLILGWANLGSLVEGTLKWFLSVFYENYTADINALRDKADNIKDPDGVTLEPLRDFFKRSVWTTAECPDLDSWILNVQQRRNAIHAYKHREIGTLDDLETAIRQYWDFLQDLEAQVPYPD